MLIDCGSGALGKLRAIRDYRDYVMSETLASKWRAPAGDGGFVARQEQGDARWVIRLARDLGGP